MSQSGFITPELVYIPAGPFLMGISESQINWLARHDTTAHQWQQKGYFVREQPQHTVTLPEYWIGRYPLTVGEFRPFIAAGGYQHSAWWTKAGWQWRRKVERAQPDYWDRAPWSVYDRLPLAGPRDWPSLLAPD